MTNATVVGDILPHKTPSILTRISQVQIGSIRTHRNCILQRSLRFDETPLDRVICRFELPELWVFGLSYQVLSDS